MRPRVPKARLPRFARRNCANTAAPGSGPGWPKALLDVVHKLLTAGAALATIMRLLF